MVAQIDRDYVSARPTRLWSRLLSYALFEGRPLTTRGRWINPLIRGQARALQFLPQFKEVEKPAYILGTGRSGTTILGIVLSMHRQVGFLNEPKLLWAHLHPNEDLIGSYNRNRANYRLGASDVTPALKRKAHKIFAGYLALSGSKRVVDKYPELIFRTGFVEEIFPDARFLFLSRGGRATCASIDGWSRRLGVEENGEKHDWWGADDRKWTLLCEQIVPEHPDLFEHSDTFADLDDTARAAVEWIVTMREGMELMRTPGKAVLHVPYEELCAKPRDWALKLESFLDLEHDEVFANYAARTLSDPARRIDIDLPSWLQPIFDQTESDLAALSAKSAI